MWRSSFGRGGRARQGNEFNQVMNIKSVRQTASNARTRLRRRGVGARLRAEQTAAGSHVHASVLTGHFLRSDAEAVEDLANDVQLLGHRVRLDCEGLDLRGPVVVHDVLGDARSLCGVVLLGEAYSHTVVAAIFVVALHDRVAVVAKGLEGLVGGVEGPAAGAPLLRLPESGV